MIVVTDSKMVLVKLFSVTILILPWGLYSGEGDFGEASCKAEATGPRGPSGKVDTLPRLGKVQRVHVLPYLYEVHVLKESRESRQAKLRRPSEPSELTYPS